MSNKYLEKIASDSQKRPGFWKTLSKDTVTGAKVGAGAFGGMMALGSVLSKPKVGLVNAIKGVAGAAAGGAVIGASAGAPIGVVRGTYRAAKNALS